MAEQQQEAKKDSRWRLNSPAAADCKWYFRCSGAALGVRASRCEMPAPTVFIPPPKLPRVTKICCKCMLVVDRLVEECPGVGCHGRKFRDSPRQHDTSTMYVHESNSGASKSSTEVPDYVLPGVVKERRIRVALEQLSRHVYHILELAYAGRQHTPEMRRVLGDHSDLASRLPRCQAAYNRYVDDGGTWGLEVWLTRRCRDRGKADPGLLRIREEAETAIGDALAEYQRYRTPPSDNERDRIERAAKKGLKGHKPPPKRKKIRRRSVLERVRAEVEAMRRGAA
jgi:hypothetical protein